MSERLHLPFELLSDENLAFVKALGLPMFEAEGMTLLKRLTLVVNDGRVEKIVYPVFPATENAEEVVGWPLQNPGGRWNTQMMSKDDKLVRWVANNPRYIQLDGLLL